MTELQIKTAILSQENADYFYSVARRAMEVNDISSALEAQFYASESAKIARRAMGVE